MYKHEHDSVAKRAHELVGGDRRADYGHPFDDFLRTGKLWAVVLEEYLRPGVVAIPPRKIAQCMRMVKESRQCNHVKEDNMTDAAGYAQTEHMVLIERDKRGLVEDKMTGQLLPKELMEADWPEIEEQESILARVMAELKQEAGMAEAEASAALARDTGDEAPTE